MKSKTTSRKKDPRVMPILFSVICDEVACELDIERASMET